MADKRLFDPLRTTATNLSQLQREGQLIAEEIVTTYLAHIAQHNSRLKALISVAPKEILIRRARHLDTIRREGGTLGPLHGLPVVFKDVIGTSRSTGLPTTGGAWALQRCYTRENADVVKKLEAAGCIIFGV